MKKKLIFVLTLVIISIGFLNSSALAIAIPGGLIRENNLVPGAKSAGRIMLLNNAKEAVTIKIYQTDYLHYADGRNLFDEAGDNKRSNLDWITFFPQQLTIEPQQTGFVDYNIAVPDDADLSGTYWSVFMVEPLVPGSPELPAKDGKINLGLKTVIRYAIQIITNFSKDSDKKLKFVKKHLQIKDNETQFLIDLENTGNRLIKANVWMDIFDARGVSLGRFDGGKDRIFPECSSRFKTDLSQLPKGDYTALLIADIGNDKVFGARYKLKIP